MQRNVARLHPDANIFAITNPIHIVGAGLAGSEAAWQVAEVGVDVVLHEMRPHRETPAHETGGFAELVCSNSFRSNDTYGNAVGLLHEEMRRCGSLVMAMGHEHRVPAGSALAVDRVGFSEAVTRALRSHPRITVVEEELSALPPPAWGSTIVATGPLTSAPLAEAIRAETGRDALAFFDAIAPIVHLDSIDMDVAWFQSRYDKVGPEGDGADYINCPMTRDQYATFIQALCDAPHTEFKAWEKDTPYFESCLPIEVMAARGPETLRYGPMKPVGLTNPHRPDDKPYAVVQLRQDNALGTLFNMVGFQTKMRHGAQTEVFRTIPGLENARFARLGGIHRNTFIDSPRLLDAQLRLRSRPDLRFAGQIMGVEGYVESAALGLVAGRMAAAEARGAELPAPPATTALGALVAHVTGGHLSGPDATFQPMNVNFGLFPPIEGVRFVDAYGKRIRGRKKRPVKRRALAERALRDLAGWAEGSLGGEQPDLAAAAA